MTRANIEPIEKCELGEVAVFAEKLKTHMPVLTPRGKWIDGAHRIWKIPPMN